MSSDSDNQIEMEKVLNALREGRLTDDEIDVAIAKFGNNYFLKAREDVETYLKSPNPDFRESALITLIIDWQLYDYKDMAEEMLLHDPGEFVRMTAAYSLASLMRRSHDQKALKLFARVVANEQEEEFVRLAAYDGIKTVLGEKYDGHNKKTLQDVDWQLVENYL